MANLLKWVQGNKLELAIPLQLVTMTSHGKIVSEYVPQEGSTVKVIISNLQHKYEYTPEIQNNVLIVTDNGEMAIGTYAVTVLVTEPDETERRSRWNTIICIYGSNEQVLDMYDDFPDYAEGQIIDAGVFFFARGEGGTNDYNQLINKPDLTQYMTNDDFSEFYNNSFSNLSNDLTQHTSNSSIHVTSSDKTNWNGKEDKMKIVDASGSTLNAEVGKCYVLEGVTNLNINLPTVTDTSEVQTILLCISTSTNPSITFSSSDTIVYHQGYKIEAMKTNEINLAFIKNKWVVAYAVVE